MTTPAPDATHPHRIRAVRPAACLTALCMLDSLLAELNPDPDELAHAAEMSARGFSRTTLAELGTAVFEFSDVRRLSIRALNAGLATPRADAADRLPKRTVPARNPFRHNDSVQNLSAAGHIATA